MNYFNKKDKKRGEYYYFLGCSGGEITVVFISLAKELNPLQYTVPW
jgi:hypothetical protein